MGLSAFVLEIALYREIVIVCFPLLCCMQQTGRYIYKLYQMPLHWCVCHGCYAGVCYRVLSTLSCLPKTYIAAEIIGDMHVSLVVSATVCMQLQTATSCGFMC